jgi:hypothetical protein
MKYWLGAVLAPFMLWLVWQSYQHVQRVKSARAAMPSGWSPASDEDADPRSLAGFGEMALPIILFALAFSAFECVAAYRVAGGEKVLSLLDMAVVLGTIAAYGFNFTLKVKYRMPRMASDAANERQGPLPWPQRLALQAQADAEARRAARQAEQARLRQPYAPESLNNTANQRLDRLSSAFPANPHPAPALEPSP